MASQCTVPGWPPITIRRFAGEAFSAFTTARCRLEFDQCHCNARRSGRVDGNGMDRCIFAKHLAGCFTNAVWWRLVMANCSRPRNVDRRPYATAEYATFAVLCSLPRNFFLLAGVGHATLNEGVTEKIHQTNHAIHLICAAAWFGGLLPVLWCMQLIKGRWRHQTIQALMRFSPVRAFCGDRRTGKRRA
ncbi:hypothetical protein ACP0HM_08190 [Escherichia coli]